VDSRLNFRHDGGGGLPIKILGIAEFFLSFLSSRRRGKFSHKILFSQPHSLIPPARDGERTIRGVSILSLSRVLKLKGYLYRESFL